MRLDGSKTKRDQPLAQSRGRRWSPARPLRLRRTEKPERRRRSGSGEGGAPRAGPEAGRRPHGARPDVSGRFLFPAVLSPRRGWWPLPRPRSQAQGGGGRDTLRSPPPPAAFSRGAPRPASLSSHDAGHQVCGGGRRVSARRPRDGGGVGPSAPRPSRLRTKRAGARRSRWEGGPARRGPAPRPRRAGSAGGRRRTGRRDLRRVEPRGRAAIPRGRRGG